MLNWAEDRFSQPVAVVIQSRPASTLSWLKFVWNKQASTASPSQSLNPRKTNSRTPKKTKIQTAVNQKPKTPKAINSTTKSPEPATQNLQETQSHPNRYTSSHCFEALEGAPRGGGRHRLEGTLQAAMEQTLLSVLGFIVLREIMRKTRMHQVFFCGGSSHFWGVWGFRAAGSCSSVSPCWMLRSYALGLSCLVWNWLSWKS